jgi:hypothetical protein
LTFGLLELHVAPRLQLFIVGGCVAVVALIASRAMLETHASADSDARHFAWPKGVLLLIGLLVFAGMTRRGFCTTGACFISRRTSACHKRGPRSVTRRSQPRWRSPASAGTSFAPVPGTLRSPLQRGRRALAMAIVLLSANEWIAFVGLAAAGAGLAPVAPICSMRRRVCRA